MLYINDHHEEDFKKMLLQATKQSRLRRVLVQLATTHYSGIWVCSDYRDVYSPAYRTQAPMRGTCLFIFNNMAYTPLLLSIPSQATAAQMHIVYTYTMCALYLPPGTPMNRQEISTLIRQILSPVLIVRDLNSRHTPKEDTISNSRGATVASVIKDLCVMNTGHSTHQHIQTDTQSVIDLPLSSPDAYLGFRWEILEDLHGSNHYLIFISLSSSLSSPLYRFGNYIGRTGSIFKQWLTQKQQMLTLRQLRIQLQCLELIFTGREKLQSYRQRETHYIILRHGGLRSGSRLWACYRLAFNRYKSHRTEFNHIVYEKPEHKHAGLWKKHDNPHLTVIYPHLIHIRLWHRCWRGYTKLQESFH